MLKRREVLKLIGSGAAAHLMPVTTRASGITGSVASDYKYCLNMATLRGHKLGFRKEIEIASKAGFRMVEIWIDSLQQYLQAGGKVEDAKKLLDTNGITVENSIGFAKWIVDDDAVRKEAIEQTKKEMDILAKIGCKRIAAPPMGATDTAGLDLKKAAERYRIILELGDQSGVVPHLELWGFSKNLCRVSEVMFVALETGHPAAKILLDVYHLYKGGSPVETLSLVGKPAVEIIHVNDYTEIKPADIKDSDRIHPGDGIAPVKQILKALSHPGKTLILSEEVFNANYYKQDALLVAKTALAKMKKITAGM
jgi:sugar phosphate isomerase/epimerase